MKTIQHKFIDIIPEELEYGVLYISIMYRTAIHKCVCGCGNQVVTPIAKNSWRISFNGDTVTLYPSIGNWRFDCMSHYWIRDGKIIHAEKWKDHKKSSSKSSKKTSSLDRFMKWIS